MTLTNSSLLDLNKILPYLDDYDLNLKLYDIVSSTNDYVKKQINTIPFNKMQKQICLAEQQTHGRGRWGRTWASPFGVNLYLSLLYPFRKPFSQLSPLSLVISLAIIKTLKPYIMPLDLHVKWPNDVIYQFKKIAGTLVESYHLDQDINQSIIGIGINVNMLDNELNIDQPWTSLKKITHSEINRNELLVKLINNLMHYISTFEKQGFDSFVHEWQAHDGLLNHEIMINYGGKKFSGTMMGISQQGLMRFQSDQGEMLLSSGEVTILK